MPTEAGYSNVKKQGQTAHKTLHTLGSSRIGAHVVPKSLAERQAIAVAITAVDLSSDTKSIRITVAGHLALVGDICRFYTGALQGAELEIISVPNANQFIIRNVVGIPAIADTIKVMYFVTPKSDQEGNVNFSPGPTTFVQNAATVTVTEDTANPANNKGLPAHVMYYKDGVPVTVNIDSVTPANNRPLPVELAGVSGPVTINAGDLSVQITATNDSVAIGDGVTGLLANVTTNATSGLEELHVRDDDANATLGTIETATTALSLLINSGDSPLVPDGIQVLGSDGTLSRFLKTNTLGQLEVVGISSALPTGAATLAEQQSQTTLLGTIDGDTSALAATVGTDGNPAPATGVIVGGKDSAGDFQHLTTNTAGELLVNFGGAAFATEATLSTINGKLTNNFGIIGDAVRVAAQLGNANGGADFNVGADSAQTLRVSANLKRSGNELSYNTGAADANTLRSVLATRHEAETTPLSVRITDGTDWLTSTTLSGTAQKVINSNGRTLKVAAFTLGFDGDEHREILVDSTGRVLTVPDAAAANTGTPTNAKITVGITAVRATVTGSAPNAARKKLYIKPTIGNSGAIYFGSSSVTTANGMQIVGPDRLEFDGATDFYLISDTAAQSVEIVEVV